MPAYPADAKEEGVQGTVELSIEITKMGAVQNPRVISGPAKLRVAAMEAVRQWVYKPYLLNGQPVEVSSTVTVNFVLPDTPAKLMPVAPPTAAASKADLASVAPGGGAIMPLAAAPPMQAEPAKVSAGVIAGYLLVRVNPRYPDEAKKTHLSGLVLMRAIISKMCDVTGPSAISGPDLGS
jgi:TonB family protein